MAIDDIVLQIETDKVTVDVRYTTGKPGKMKEMLVKEEDTVSVGQQVATVTEGEEGSKPEEVHWRTYVTVCRTPLLLQLRLQTPAVLLVPFVVDTSDTTSPMWGQLRGLLSL